MASNDLSDTIRETATGPARVSIDGSSVDAQKVADQILAEQHLAGRTSAAKNHLGLRFVRLQSQGGG